MNKALTVGELIVLLQAMDPEAECWVEREGEHRRLTESDVSYQPRDLADEAYLYDAETGEEYENKTGLVTFDSWS